MSIGSAVLVLIFCGCCAYSLVGAAVAASGKLADSQKAEFSGLIRALRSQLVVHRKELTTKLRHAKNGQRGHLAKITSQMKAINATIDKKNATLTQTLYDISDLNERITGKLNPVALTDAQLEKLNATLARLYNRMDREDGFYTEQDVNRKARMELIDKIRLAAQEQLVNPNPLTRARLASLSDYFPAPRCTSCLALCMFFSSHSKPSAHFRLGRECNHQTVPGSVQCDHGFQVVPSFEPLRPGRKQLRHLEA